MIVVIMLVVTTLVAGAIQQSDPEQMADMDACIAKGRQAVEASDLDVNLESFDKPRAVGFSCVRKLVPGTDL